MQDIVATDDTLVSCGMDDMIMFTKLATVAQAGYVTCVVHLCIILSTADVCTAGQPVGRLQPRSHLSQNELCRAALGWAGLN